MNIQHKKLADGGWEELTLAEQLSNIGSEVNRALNWREKKNNDFSQRALERGLELLSLSINDKKNIKHLKELTRLHELLIDYFYFDNIYNSSDALWKKYFMAFNVLARR